MVRQTSNKRYSIKATSICPVSSTDRAHGYVTKLIYKKNMDTIQKGVITELQCQIDFTKLGYVVSQPISPCRYDFVIDVDGKFIRVQCKSCHPIDEECSGVKFECRSTRNVKQGDYSNHRKYLDTEIDYFYTCWNGIGYLIPVSQCSTNKTLRFTKPKNGNVSNISYAKDYEITNIL